MHEATIRITDETTYASATADTEATIELWCNEHCDLLHVVGPAGDTVDHVRSEVGVRDAIREDGEQFIITQDCLKQQEEGHIEVYVQRHDCLLLPPLKYEHGDKLVRVLALDSAQLTALYRDLSDDFPVEVESKQTVKSPASDSPLLRLDVLLPELSPRQREVLERAFQEGYYEIPRDVTTEQLSREFGIDRRTLEDHLRRAEQKLVSTFNEHLA